jgi:hypothetical protein
VAFQLGIDAGDKSRLATRQHGQCNLQGARSDIFTPSHPGIGHFSPLNVWSWPYLNCLMYVSCEFVRVKPETSPIIEVLGVKHLVTNSTPMDPPIKRLNP